MPAAAAEYRFARCATEVLSDPLIRRVNGAARSDPTKYLIAILFFVGVTSCLAPQAKLISDINPKLASPEQKQNTSQTATSGAVQVSPTTGQQGLLNVNYQDIAIGGGITVMLAWMAFSYRNRKLDYDESVQDANRAQQMLILMVLCLHGNDQLLEMYLRSWFMSPAKRAWWRFI